MDTLLGFGLLILGILIYLAIFLFIPFLASSGTKYTKKKITIIALVNSVVIAFLINLIHNYPATNILMAIISFFIARKIMINRCLDDECEVMEQPKEWNYIH